MTTEALVETVREIQQDAAALLARITMLQHTLAGHCACGQPGPLNEEGECERCEALHDQGADWQEGAVYGGWGR